VPDSAASPPAPTPGSLRYFVLLYTPAARRPALASLLALSDEIGAGLSRQLDHELAHTRLNWWQRELAQHAAGVAQHPLLRVLRLATPAESKLDLSPLLQAASIDLAEGLLNAGRGEQLRRETFILAATALGAPALSTAQRAALGALGAKTLHYERSLADTPEIADDAASLQQAVSALGGALQPIVAPLLVWTALSAARARRRTKGESSKSRSLLDGFIDNMNAWKAARAAANGSLKLL
jgi:hypothetical protein